MKKTRANFIEQVTETAESLDWNVDIDDRYITFQWYSNAGQDFNVTINLDGINDIADMADAVYDYYESFDPDEEASYWIGDDGHGKNGAPYHLRDLLDDMEECKEKIYELYVSLCDLVKEV